MSKAPAYLHAFETLRRQPRRWLVTGAAGFIGSHLVRALLQQGQDVVGLDDLSAGTASNLKAIDDGRPSEGGGAFSFVQGDVRDEAICRHACRNVDIILHHAAISSVQKSLENPVLTDSVNTGGFLTLMQAAVQSGVKRVVYASSSAVYGDAPPSAARGGVGGDDPLPSGRQKEDDPVTPLSPYAVSKYANELYAATVSETQGLESVGLRYYNVYGPRQQAAGIYAAVIPRWLDALRAGEAVEIYGDGETVRDFCDIDDVVQANIRAALTDDRHAVNQVYNIGSGTDISLNQLYAALRAQLQSNAPPQPVYRPFRKADIKISRADITKARQRLGYEPAVSLEAGLQKLIAADRERDGGNKGRAHA